MSGAVCLAVTSLLVLTLAGCVREQPRPLTLATTTSVANSGLLDALLPAFQREHQRTVRSHLVGSGRALRMLERGHADVVISHAPAAEASALRQHPDWRYRKVMFNDFIIVGPRDDPAHVKGAPDAGTAMQRIAASQARFFSRGDRSGTHEREERLWQLAGQRPSTDRLVVAGAGMGATLRIASETGGYTLTDRATFRQLAHNLRLVAVYEGSPLLLNTYAILIVPRGQQSDDAQAFFEWLTDGPGRAVIDGYRVGGTRAFVPWPKGRPRESPDASPR